MKYSNPFTNQTFCYWLQGYFEVSGKADLDAVRIKIIADALSNISEEKGDFTAWLAQICETVMITNNQELINRFAPLIQSELNQIFLHVIDQSYDTDKTLEYLLDVHQGKIKNDK